MVEMDLDFHRTMCALTGNATLVHAWESLAGSIRMSIMFAGADSAVTYMSVPRHQQIVDAVATGDPNSPGARSSGTCRRRWPTCPTGWPGSHRLSWDVSGAAADYTS